MAVDYSTTVLTERLQIVIDNIDGGSTNGFMLLLSGAATTLATFQLSRPCGVASAGVLNFSGLSLIDPSAAASGTATLARFTNGNGVVVLDGLTVGTGSSSFELQMTPSNIITAGQTLAITAAAITGN